MPDDRTYHRPIAWISRAGEILTRLLVACFALLLGASQALAGTRLIPADAKRVLITIAGSRPVMVGEQRYRISAAAQFRDQNNRIVAPASLRGDYPARVIIDRNGDLFRAWLLSPEEAAVQSAQ